MLSGSRKAFEPRHRNSRDQGKEYTTMKNNDKGTPTQPQWGRGIDQLEKQTKKKVKLFLFFYPDLLYVKLTQAFRIGFSRRDA